MDIGGIREALHKQPFEPFSLRLADGRALSVPDRDLVALHPRRIIVINEDASCSVIEPLLIVSIDYDARPKKARMAPAAGRGPRSPSEPLLQPSSSHQLLASGSR